MPNYNNHRGFESTAVELARDFIEELPIDKYETQESLELSYTGKPINGKRYPCAKDCVILLLADFLISYKDHILAKTCDPPSVHVAIIHEPSPKPKQVESVVTQLSTIPKPLPPALPEPVIRISTGETLIPPPTQQWEVSLEQEINHPNLVVEPAKKLNKPMKRGRGRPRKVIDKG